MSSANEVIVWQELSPFKKTEFVISSGHLADCRFIVGKDPNNTKTFSCHKIFLSFESPVFEAMLYSGSKKFQSNTTIRLLDAEPLEFEKFLKYIYTKDTDKLRKLNTNMLLLLAGLSSKYMVTKLEKSCLAIIEDRMYSFGQHCQISNHLWKRKIKCEPLCCDDLLKIFAYAKRKNHAELLKANIKAIQSVSGKIIKCRYITQLDIDHFKDIVELVGGYMTEAVRFQLIEIYVKVNILKEISKADDFQVKNEELQKEPCPYNGDSQNAYGITHQKALYEHLAKRCSELIFSLVQLIRFEEMSVAEFFKGPGNSDLLSPQAKYDILAAIMKSKNSNLIVDDEESIANLIT